MCAEWQRSSRDRDSQEVGLEAAILERVRNSSLVAVARRRECSGLSVLPKRRIGPITGPVVGERPPGGEAVVETAVDRGGVRMPV